MLSFLHQINISLPHPNNIRRKQLQPLSFIRILAPNMDRLSQIHKALSFGIPLHLTSFPLRNNIPFKHEARRCDWVVVYWCWDGRWVFEED